MTVQRKLGRWGRQLGWLTSAVALLSSPAARADEAAASATSVAPAVTDPGATPRTQSAESAPPVGATAGERSADKPTANEPAVKATAETGGEPAETGSEPAETGSEPAEAAPAEDHSAFLSFIFPLEIHGFISQGFLKSVQNDYLAKTKRGSLEFSEVGLNLTKQLTHELRVGVQLFAHDLGPTGNYQPQVDWFYIDYRFRDWLGIRVGRTKVPFGFFNEINDVDAARAPILPQSVYPTDHREYLFAQTGGEIYGNVPLGPIGALEYRLYGGTLLASNLGGGPPPNGITVSNVEIPYIFGGRALWQTPLEGLQLGFSLQQLELTSDYDIAPDLLGLLKLVQLVPADLTVPTPVKFRVTRWVGSLAYSVNDLDLTVEYSRWLGEFDSKLPILLPEHIVNERYYAMASYRVNSWFTPSIYYSAYFPNILNRHKHQNYQHDLALSVRYDLTENWLLKLEGHYLRGTASIDNRSLNDGKEGAELKPDWALFAIKTTAYF